MPYFNLHLSIIMTIYATELAVTGTLFTRHLARRDHYPLRVACCVLAAFVYCFLIPLEAFSYAIHLPLAFLSFVYIGLCYQANFVTVIFIGEAVYIVQCMESALNTILSFLNPQVLGHFGTDIKISVYGYLLMLFSYVVTLSVVYLIFARRIQSMELQGKERIPVLALAGVVLIVNHLWVFTSQLTGQAYQTSITNLADNVWSLVCCALCLSIQLGLFDSSQKDHELEIARKLMEQKQEQYKASRSMVLAINKKCHQLKIRLSELSAQGGEQKQIHEAMELLDSFDAAVHTGNEVLDIIFTEKNSYCLQAHITFVCMIDGEKLNFMAPADLYVLFGSMIDSGIRSVSKLQDQSKRTIYVNVHSEKNLLLIQIEYPVEESVRNTALLRDFSTQSIRMIVEKYDGSSNTKLEDHTFYQNIVLPMQ